MDQSLRRLSFVALSMLLAGGVAWARATAQLNGTKARLESTWELMEYISQENETNVTHIQGPANSSTANGGAFGR